MSRKHLLTKERNLDKWLRCPNPDPLRRHRSPHPAQPSDVDGSTARLLDRKEFDDISVQEIADEATLNRATFYLHYADKNALLQAMTAARFRDLIARRGLSFTNCDGALTRDCVSASAIISPRLRAAPASWRRCLSKARSSRSWRVCSGKALRIIRIAARSRSRTAGNYGCLGHLRGGAAVATRLRTAFPLRRWLPRLKRW